LANVKTRFRARARPNNRHGMLHPMHGTEHPMHGTEHPMQGTEHPMHRTEHPMQGTERPVHGTEHPMHGIGRSRRQRHGWHRYVLVPVRRAWPLAMRTGMSTYLV